MRWTKVKPGNQKLGGEKAKQASAPGGLASRVACPIQGPAGHRGAGDAQVAQRRRGVITVGQVDPSPPTPTASGAKHRSPCPQTDGQGPLRPLDRSSWSADPLPTH